MIVDEATPPNVHWGAYWERSADPHNPGLAQAVIDVHTSANRMSPEDTGWALIDWIENVIGFIPDGSEMDGDPIEYVYGQGMYGRKCAYNKNCKFSMSYIEQHQKHVIEANANLPA